MKIIKEKAGIYKVESQTPGKLWTVDVLKNTCTCPHYLFRMRKTGGDCKHLIAVKEYASGSENPHFEAIISYVRENVFVDSIDLIERFGQEPVDEMIRSGELTEEHGKIRLL